MKSPGALAGCLLLVGCAAVDSDLVASGVAVAGDWVPPARTLALSNPQYVPVVDPPRITGSCVSTCPGNVWGACTDPACTGPMTGTVEVQRYIQGRWSFVGAGGNFSCRRNSNPSSCNYLSVHSIGRAMDLMIPVTASGDADNTLGDQVANWLIENAEYIGVQRVIWDGKYWNGSRPNNHFSDISDAMCGARYCTDHHVNHIHAELSVDGAARRTPFFTMGAPPMTCPVVCYGNAAVRADCSFTDCAAMGQVCVPDPPRCAPAESPAAVRNATATLPAASTRGGLVRFQSLAPARLFDTRTAADSTLLARSDGATSGPLTATRTGTISNLPGLPAGASGVWMNVAAVPLTEPGFVAAYPAGASTDSSTVNYAPPAPRANAAAIALGAANGITFRSSSAVDVIADRTGAFAPTGLGLRTIAPTRVIDTRATRPVSAGAPFAIDVRGPADARAVVANIAVIARGTAGFLRAFPCGSPAPDTSNINYAAAGVFNNLVMTPLTDGQLCVQSSSEVDVIVDTSGFLVDSGELSLQLLTPLRVLDTRSATSIYTGRLGAGQVIEIPISSIPGVAASARAVLANVTSVGSSAGGFVTVFPCEAMAPNTSSLNYAAGAVVPSAVVSALGSGRLCLVSNQRTHLVVDLLGVWLPAAGSTPTDPTEPPPDMPEDPGMDSPDASPPSADASAATDAGASPSDSGAATARDAASGLDGSDAQPPAVNGCGCRAPNAPDAPRSLAWLTVAAALVMGARRRRAGRLE